MPHNLRSGRCLDYVGLEALRYLYNLLPLNVAIDSDPARITGTLSQRIPLPASVPSGFNDPWWDFYLREHLLPAMRRLVEVIRERGLLVSGAFPQHPTDVDEWYCVRERGRPSLRVDRVRGDDDRDHLVVNVFARTPQ